MCWDIIVKLGCSCKTKAVLVQCADAKEGRECAGVEKVEDKSYYWCSNSVCRHRAYKRLDRQMKYLEEKEDEEWQNADEEWQRANDRRLEAFKEQLWELAKSKGLGRRGLFRR